MAQISNHCMFPAASVAVIDGQSLGVIKSRILRNEENISQKGKKMIFHFNF
jgi:hypothetical protein